VNIIKDDRIFLKYFASIAANFIRTDDTISEITIHGTGGFNSAPAELNWMMGGERQADYVQGIGLFHYIIDRDGMIYQIIPDEYWVHHSSSGHHDQFTLGIELVNPTTNNSGKYTLDQYNSLFDLIKFAISKYNIFTIAGHSATCLKYSGIVKKPPKCPGDGFRWEMLESNFNAEKIEDERYKLI
jgi:hypothetical protein